MTTLWYRQPAKLWTDALPIGNGRLGGMVFGGVHEERIALNDDTLWSGAPQDGTNPGAYKTLGEVREFLAKGEYAKADEMSKRMMGPYTQSYLALGNLHLKFLKAGEHEPFGQPTEYRRSLDLATGIARTEFVVDGARFVREVFCSNPDQVLAIRVTTDGPGKFDLLLNIDSHWGGRWNLSGKPYLQFEGKAPALVDPTYYRRNKIVQEHDGEGMRFIVSARAIETDGEVWPDEDDYDLYRATHVTILLTAATSFSNYLSSPTRAGRDYKEVAKTQMDLASRKSWETLRRTHESDHGGLFNRVSFSLGKIGADITTADNHSVVGVQDRPTDELLHAKDDDAQQRLTELLFQYGRYLLIASSRPGDQPANLQGIWNEEKRAPWSGNFTVNINTQMNYWPAGPANLLECQEPLLQLIEDLAWVGRSTAEVNYGIRGWCAHHNVDLWRNTNPVGDWGSPPADPVWAIWPMGGVWLCQHIWEHFLFGGDYSRLESTWFEVLAGASRFVLGFLVESPDGKLTTSPSTSPEHRFIGPDGKTHALSVGSSSDLQMIHELLTITLAAGELIFSRRDTSADEMLYSDKPISLCSLHAREINSEPEEIGEAFLDEIRNALGRLATTRVLPDGRVAEWSHDFPGEDEHHRHVSHLFAIHPGRQWAKDEKMRAAARKSLEVRGNASTGWSLAWKINLWARLLDGEQALDCMRILFTPVTENSLGWQGGVYLNLFDAHPPFQIDGNFGFTSGVCEMLLQSHAGELHLLPALPKSWANGRVTGLRARGGITVDLIWKGGQLTGGRLASTTVQTVQVRVGEVLRTVLLNNFSPFDLRNLLVSNELE